MNHTQLEIIIYLKPYKKRAEKKYRCALGGKERPSWPSNENIETK